MKREVVLHGHLSSFHEGPILVSANTVADAVECVTRQLPGFAPHPVYGRQRIKVVGCEAYEDLHKPLGDQVEIHIVPQFNGGKDGVWTEVAVGVALVGVGIALGPTGFFGSLLLKAGALTLLGSLAQVLAPAPASDQGTDKSRYLGAPTNTTQIGTRIPILYGEARVGGQYLSFDINAQEFKGSAASSGSGASK